MMYEQIEYPEDLKLLAWAITAKHLCRGEEDITKIVADAIWQERQKWVKTNLSPVEDEAQVG